MHLAVALDGAGWHPAAWREPRARPAELFTARYWADLVAEAERGLLDFVTIEDRLACSPVHCGPTTAPTRSRAAGRGAHRGPGGAADPPHRAWCRPSSSPTPSRSTSPRPSPPWTTSAPAGPGSGSGSRRARTRPRTSAGGPPAAGLRDRATRPCRQLIAELFDEAADYVEVIRRLWDSWEDDAEIRDVATGRFVDRDKLHYIDFAGALVQRQGPVDHAAAAAGPAGGRRARARERAVPS